MSTNPRIYLDFNASAPMIPAVRAAMAAALADPGWANPSSIHAEGRRARHLVETARDAIAALAGAPRERVVFTSGGTEANALGVALLAGEAERRGLPRVAVTTAWEHPSLLAAVAALASRGWRVDVVGPDALPAAAPGAGLVAFGRVNHELGTVTERPLGPALVHIDAVQAAGKLALLAADSIALSAHKLGGPPGVGAVVVREDLAPADELEPGHQERGRRAGTENVVGIAGFGAAAAADPASWPAVASLGAELERGLVGLGATIHGAERPRVGGTINAGFPGALGESLVIALDLVGIAASTGAACSSGSIKPSPVLLALGLSPAAARSAVRFSLGRSTTAAEVAAVLAALPPILARARR
jgi:cysteine desulfurase